MIDNNVCVCLLKEEIQHKGFVQLKVHGNSMFPILKDGDIVTLRKNDEYHRGDIVSYFFITDNRIKIIVHRIIFKRKDYVLTKGDNNNFIDPLRVSYNQLIGIVEV